MENNQRLAIILSMAVVTVWLIWENQQVDERQAAQRALDATRQEQLGDGDGAAPGLDSYAQGSEVPLERRAPFDESGSREAREGTRDAGNAALGESQARQNEIPRWERLISGDLYEAKLSNEGGALVGWTLRNYHSTARDGREETPIDLVAPGIAGAAPLTPLLELGYGDLSSARYMVESESADAVVFRLNRGGLTVRKTYRFDPSRYEFDLEIDVHNGSTETIDATLDVVWPASVLEGNDYTEQSVVALHAEEVEREPLTSVGQPNFFSRLFSGGDEDEIWGDVRWAGADLKYFAALLLPEKPQDAIVTFASVDPGKTGAAVIAMPTQHVAPGASITRRFTGYLGPKDPVILEEIGRELNRSVDLGYSWVEPLTLFFHWVLNVCYSVIPNYGWSIVLITILVRVATLPIMNRQMKSMERMRALQPQLKELQAKFGDDRQKQSEATMALYKESGVNPLGGCLPMLLQFPVFIGLFYALRSSFALRQAPFFGWITDLSAPEVLFVLPFVDFPFRLLPVIMGASMILQQRLTPTTVDPSQQMMMMVIMPIMMTVLFYQFPSGLVLYWMISNFLGIGHQLLVGRRMKAAEA